MTKRALRRRTGYEPGARYHDGEPGVLLCDCAHDSTEHRTVPGRLAECMGLDSHGIPCTCPAFARRNA